MERYEDFRVLSDVLNREDIVKIAKEYNVKPEVMGNLNYGDDFEVYESEWEYIEAKYNTVEDMFDDMTFDYPTVTNKSLAHNLIMSPGKGMYFVGEDNDEDVAYVEILKSNFTVEEGDYLVDSKYLERVDMVDLEGRVILLYPSTYKVDYRSAKYLLVRATGGFGCSPTASGRAVYYTSLSDEDKGVAYRQDVQMVIKREFEDEVVERYCK